MKLQLTREDFEAAIRMYISGLMILTPEAGMQIKHNADGGAEIDINYLSVAGIPAIAAAASNKPAVAAPAPTAAAAPVQETKTAAPAAETSAAPAAPKIDLRTKEGREMKRKGLFDKVGITAPKAGEKPTDAVDVATHNITRDPTPQEIAAATGSNEEEESSAVPVDVEASTDTAEGTPDEKALRAAEAEAILSEPEAPTPTEEASTEMAVAAVEDEEDAAPPPPPATPRKSLFGS